MKFVLVNLPVLHDDFQIVDVGYCTKILKRISLDQYKPLVKSVVVHCD